MSIFASRPRILKAHPVVSPGITRRAGLAALGSLGLIRPNRPSRRPAYPVVRADPERARRLDDLAERFVSMGLEQAELHGQAEEMNEAYSAWHGTEPCPDTPKHHVCRGGECHRRWREYCEVDGKADDIREARQDLYRELIRQVEAGLEELGVEPSPHLEDDLGRWCCPLARVETDGHSFLLVGSVNFYEGPYLAGWGDTEVIIDA